LRRVIEFLVMQGILVEVSSNGEKQKLWKTSWDIISAFFKSLQDEVKANLAPN